MSAGFTFGGGGASFTTRRGAEKTLFRMTILFSVLFFGLALARIFLVDEPKYTHTKNTLPQRVFL